MSEYKKVVEHIEAIGIYSSPVFGRFEAITNLVHVSVVGPDDQTVWEKQVKDRSILFAIPLPFFERRLGHIAARAEELAANLSDI